MSNTDDNIIDPFVSFGPAKTLMLSDGDICAVLTQVNQARWLLERVQAGEPARDDHLAKSILGLSQLFEQLRSGANEMGMGIELDPVLQAKIDAQRPVPPTH